MVPMLNPQVVREEVDEEELEEPMGVEAGADTAAGEGLSTEQQTQNNRKTTEKQQNKRGRVWAWFGTLSRAPLHALLWRGAVVRTPRGRPRLPISVVLAGLMTTDGEGRGTTTPPVPRNGLLTRRTKTVVVREFRPVLPFEEQYDFKMSVWMPPEARTRMLDG